MSIMGAAGLGYANGGHVKGAGTGTSDSIMARLSNGEFVINAKATKTWLPLLEQINGGILPKFATGGMVGGNMSQPSNVDLVAHPSQTGGNQQTININITGDVSRQTRKEVLGMSNEIANMVHGSFKEKRIM